MMISSSNGKAPSTSKPAGAAARDGVYPLSPGSDDPHLPSIDQNPYAPSSTSTSSLKPSSQVKDALYSPIARYPQPSSHPSSTGFPPPRLTPSPSPSPSPSGLSTLDRLLTSLGIPAPVLTLIKANTGLLLVASSQIFFVGMGLTAKFFVSSTSLSTFTLIFVRMSITALFSGLWLHYTGNPNPFLGPPDPRIRRLLVLRGFMGFGGLFSNYQSLRGLSVSDSVTIQFLAPNITAVLGWVVLGEVLGWREISAGVACLGGVLLVSRPPFLFGTAAGAGEVGDGIVDGVGDGMRGTGTAGGGMEGEGGDAGITHADRLLAVGWAFVAVSFASCAYITIRKIGKQAHAMHSMLYFCYACLITSFIGTIVQFRSFVFIQSWKEFWLIMLIGVFGFIGQILLTFGLQREKAGRASLAMYLSLFYSLIFELVFFGTVPPFLSLLGAFIIIVSAVWVAVSKKTEDPPSTGYERVNTDEESVPVSRSRSRSPSPNSIPLEFRSKRTDSPEGRDEPERVHGHWSEKKLEDDGVGRNGSQVPVRPSLSGVAPRMGSGSGTGSHGATLGVDGRVLRRKSSASSGIGLDRD